MALGAIAEDWTKIYKAFEQINFKAYDYDSVKSSLIDYLKLNYPENFNDYVESSEMIMLVELFAYVAEQLAYRVDMAAHENFISTAERKQSILRLAKLISYSPKRCISASGFVKIDSVTTTEDIRDAQGNLLRGKVIRWNDANNPFWKDQFIQVMNCITNSDYGSPIKSITIDATSLSLYTFNNMLGSIQNNVITTTATVGSESFNLEVCSAEVDRERGIIEGDHDSTKYFSLVFSNDGLGDASVGTGYILPIKEGLISRIAYTFSDRIPNRVLELGLNGINNDDVWINELVEGVATKWTQVESILGTNLYFNTIADTKKYEVETMENDQIRLIFGDGNFSEMPYGEFEFYIRQSAGRAVYVPKNAIAGASTSFKYMSRNNVQETCTISYSLTESIQSGSASESVERIRQIAPTTYYAQNRMVNAQDYNTLLLRDQSILKLKSVNRTFAGQPKYVAWNDASGSYQNVKIFGDDLAIFYNVKDSTFSRVESSRTLIDNVLQPQILSIAGLSNSMIYRRFNQIDDGVYLRDVVSIPRKTFIERTNINSTGRKQQEKTSIQGQLDRHFYGEPDRYVSIFNQTLGINQTYAVVDGDADQKIWDTDTPLVVTDATKDSGYSVINANGSNYQITQGLNNVFGLRFVPFTIPFNTDWMVAFAPIKSNVDLSAVLSKVKNETITVECINENGNGPLFLVTSSLFGQLGTVSGDDSAWVLHESQDYKMTLKQNASVFGQAILGDAIIIDVSSTGFRVRPFIFADDSNVTNAVTTTSIVRAVETNVSDFVNHGFGSSGKVLLKGQTNISQNGLYTIKTGGLVKDQTSVDQDIIICSGEINLNTILTTGGMTIPVYSQSGLHTLVNGDRVLLMFQTDTTKNGIYEYVVSGTTRTFTRISTGNKFTRVSDGTNAWLITHNVNLMGEWKTVLSSNNTDIDPIWDIKVERGAGANVWTVVVKDYKIEIYSPTTKFWFNSSAVIIDSNTKNRVRDNVQLLKSNLTADGSRAIGENKYFDVIDFSYSKTGDIVPSKLEVIPSDFYSLAKQKYVSGDNVPNDMHQLLTLLAPRDYCYFTVDGSTLNETFIPKTTVVDGKPIHQKTFNKITEINGIYMSNQPVMIITGSTSVAGQVQLRLQQNGVTLFSNTTYSSISAGSTVDNPEYNWLTAISANINIADTFKLDANVIDSTGNKLIYTKNNFNTRIVNNNYIPGIDTEIYTPFTAIPNGSGGSTLKVNFYAGIKFEALSNNVVSAQLTARFDSTRNVTVPLAKNATFTSPNGKTYDKWEVARAMGHYYGTLPGETDPTRIGVWIPDFPIASLNYFEFENLPPNNNFNIIFTLTLVLASQDSVEITFTKSFAIDGADNTTILVDNNFDLNAIPPRPKVPYVDEVVNLNFLITKPVNYTSSNTAYTKKNGTPPTYSIINSSGDPIEIINPSTFVVDGITITDLVFTAINVDDFFIDSNGQMYTKRPGREGLDFLWQHFAPSDHLIDPSTSNIIDVFVITQGYYSSLMEYVSGNITSQPLPPSSLSLKSSYSAILQNKMISDTVIMNSGKIKLLFGQKAIQEFQARVKIVKNPYSNVSDNQIRTNTITAINEYFNIAKWDFGQIFYATDLISYLHKQLGNTIASVVLVPVFKNNSFGSLFTIIPNGDEILMSCLEIGDIDIVSNLDPVTLRQRLN